MAKVIGSLLFVALVAAWTQTAEAAPAPFPKSPASDAPVSVERLKQHLLREHNLYADGIEPGAQPNEWIVKGNAPMVYDGRLMYQQKFYIVSVTGTDRRG